MGIIDRNPKPPKPIWRGAGREIIGDPIKGRRAIRAYRVVDGDEVYVCVEYTDGEPPEHSQYAVRDWNDHYGKDVFESTRMPINGPVGPIWPEVRRKTA